jgi:hypothetical protein
MPAGRWAVLVVWVCLSLVLSLGALAWAFFAPEGAVRPTPRVPSVLQLLELVFAVGLFARADWAYRWSVRWYLVKSVYAAGLGVGMWIGGCRPVEAAVPLALGVFWGGLTLFLWRNREYFD